MHVCREGANCVCSSLHFNAAANETGSVKTYEDMTLEELQENEDEFSEEDERAIEMYRSVPAADGRVVLAWVPLR